MHVVAAGVHHADLFAIPGCARLRGERHVDLFGDRQRVHVGAQRHHRPGQRALEQADDAGVGDAGADLVETEAAQVLGNDRRSAEFAIAQLGVRVQVTAPGDDLRLESLRGAVDAGGEGGCDDGVAGHGGLSVVACRVNCRPPRPGGPRCDIYRNWSLGQGGINAQFAFTNATPVSVSGGPGAEYGGPPISVAGNTVFGSEGNGTVQFIGTFTSISWTDPVFEIARRSGTPGRALARRACAIVIG